MAYVCCQQQYSMHLNYSLYHPASNQSVLASLIHRVRALCDWDTLTQELEFLTAVFKENR